ncbi:MAG TPA: glycosyltransferase family 2 protein [Candidatus Hydrogenedens sp.]|nr:glycosyltransferase family 2 protein [Candidatus Hydrogenedens sp.]HOK08446.1 glycosyltransferase family 2 protein [Candidatus Hydrogenedens sp.]HOL20289.1 glycosyltransferase family 2 protein [Candidatus Hydrogenedens sp.]HPP58141.1 glycosyltransferase family 2 protein [Candidatus Hydrogenedens sp.]
MNESEINSVMPVSVIIPCYNEAENIPLLVERIDQVFKEKININYECILVDDGSTDSTQEVLNSLRNSYPALRPLHLQKNCGQSFALWQGLKYAKGNHIVILDGDLQNDPNDIPNLLNELKTADFVQGYRKQRKDEWLRTWISKQANRIIRFILDNPVQDTGCALKAMKKECIPYIIPFNGSHRYYAFLLHSAGFHVTELPVNHYPRKYGTSKYNISGRLFKTLFDIIGLFWWKKRVLRCNK